MSDVDDDNDDAEEGEEKAAADLLARRSSGSSAESSGRDSDFESDDSEGESWHCQPQLSLLGHEHHLSVLCCAVTLLQSSTRLNVSQITKPALIVFSQQSLT